MEWETARTRLAPTPPEPMTCRQVKGGVGEEEVRSSPQGLQAALSLKPEPLLPRALATLKPKAMSHTFLLPPTCTHDSAGPPGLYQHHRLLPLGRHGENTFLPFSFLHMHTHSTPPSPSHTPSCANTSSHSPILSSLLSAPPLLTTRPSGCGTARLGEPHRWIDCLFVVDWVSQLSLGGVDL